MSIDIRERPIDTGGADTRPGPATPDDDSRGRYRGRRRLVAAASRRAAKWGTAAVVAAVGVVLVGTGVLARTLSDPLTVPVLPPQTPTAAPAESTAPVPEGIARLGDGPAPTATPSADPAVTTLPPPPASGTPSTAPGGPGGGPEGAPDGQTSPGTPGAPGPAPAATAATTATTTTPATTAAPVSAEAACHVEVVLVDQWSTGFRADYTITNNGARIDGWTLQVSVASGVTLDSGWQANWSQQGRQVTARNAPWNQTIRAGRSVLIGHVAVHQSSVTPSFSGATLNGTSCTMTS